MALELSYFMDKLLVSGFVVQDFFIESLDILKQLRNQAAQLLSCSVAQLLSIELIERSGRSHGADFD